MSAISHDELLAKLLDQLVADVRAGRRPHIEAAAREHPEMATELRELWGAVMVADAVAQHSSMVQAPPHPSCLPQEDKNPVAPGAGASKQFGDYELLAEVGRGGMGVVYRARQIS